jgi:hypothetical protein
MEDEDEELEANDRDIELVEAVRLTLLKDQRVNWCQRRPS